MMRRFRIAAPLLILIFVPPAFAVDPPSLDLRRAVPDDVYMVVHGLHNPERDFQSEHYAQVWKTVEETQIVEKFMAIVSKSVPADRLGDVESVWEDVRAAAAPIDLNALSEVQEGIYAQRMQGFTNQQLAALRLGPAAAKWEEGLKNLMALAEKYSDGAVPVQTSQLGDISVTSLGLPSEAQFQPMVARIDDVLFLVVAFSLGEKPVAYRQST